MKFAYIAAALLPFAYARVALDTTEDSLATLEARDEKLAFVDEAFAELEEREDDIFEEEGIFLSEIEEREALGGLEPADFEPHVDDTLEVRSAKSILGALKTLHAQTVKTKALLDKFGNSQKPSNRQALAVRAQAQKLSGAISKATSAAQKSSKLSGGASKQVFAYIQKTLVPTTLATLKDFAAHKTAFKKGNYTALVKSNLVAQKGQVAKLGKALLSKAGSKSVKAKGKKVLKKVQKAFSATIKKY